MPSTSRSSPGSQHLAKGRWCAIPECQVKFAHCEPHHIEYWENGGNTDMDNLVPLCSRHHHAAHEGGWKLRLDPDTRELTVDLPATNRHGP
jgi:hypothetical protein